MKAWERIQSVIFYGVFVCYLLFLLKLLLLSRVSLLEIFNGERSLSRTFNFIPFYSIIDFIFGTDANAQKFAFSNVVGNIAIFIPLGVYLSLLKKNKKVLSTLLVIFLVSLGVELFQALLALGTADVDDIILNCLGGWIGILGYKLLLLIFGKEKKVRTVITVLSVIGFPVLFYLLFMVRMRL